MIILRLQWKSQVLIMRINKIQPRYKSLTQNKVYFHLLGAIKFTLDRIRQNR